MHGCWDLRRNYFGGLIHGAWSSAESGCAPGGGGQRRCGRDRWRLELQRPGAHAIRRDICAGAAGDWTQLSVVCGAVEWRGRRFADFECYVDAVQEFDDESGVADITELRGACG